jgi:predicted nucleic acid-binding protein
MILVDTSVWIEYFRNSDRRLTTHLQNLLEEDQIALAVPVKIEILGGSSARDFPRLQKVMSALPLICPSDSTWDRIEGWVEKAVSKGQRFGFADLLIAALAAERNTDLWSLDADFVRMEKLGYVRLHDPS